MRIQLISDVHTEFHADGGRGYLRSLQPDGVDVLVVAGDLTTARRLRGVLRVLCAAYPNVVYVTGNHEYYGSDRGGVHGLLSRLGTELPNLHWLEDRAVTLGGQRFVGCALWFPEADDGLNPAFSGFMSDFSAIDGFSTWVYEANARSRAFLEDTLRPDDVVVTHHLPHPDAVSPVFRAPPYVHLNRFFLCDMADLIARVQPALWCFGHTHRAVDRQVGATRLLCNPLGYPREPASGYRHGLTVDRRRGE